MCQRPLIFSLITTLFLSCEIDISKNNSPNIIIIMADDLGYGDLSIYGNKKIQTPNIDMLGNDGLLFTDFHSNGTVCSPTRAALLTGKYQQRVGVKGVITAKNHRHVGLSLKEKTFAEIAKQVGYQTAIFGKWHLGYEPKFNPTQQGFDEYIGFVSGNVDYHSHIDQEGYEDWWFGSELKKEQGYSTDLINEHAVDFIKRNKDQRFLLYIAHEAPHYPIQGRLSPPERGSNRVNGKGSNAFGSEKNKSIIYKEMIEVMDEGIGRVIETLSELNLDKKTIVFFFSDNGGTKLSNNGELRAGKGSVYEGGHRVSALVWAPELIKAGRVSDQQIMTMDIFPTVANLIGAVPDEEIDGLSFKNHLLNGEKIEDRSLFWEYNNNLAMRKGKWKIVIGRKNKIPELFNLEKDLGETLDIAEQNPRLVEEMMTELEAWKKYVKF
tara:strand:- start:4917 stop:6227 length:1311 start_codon:yes stop_codon:yes gene_type:complete